MADIFRILGNTEIIVELDPDLPCPLQLLVIEPVDPRMGMDQIIHAMKMEGVQEWLIECDPNGHAIGKISQQDLSVVHKAGIVSDGDTLARTRLTHRQRFHSGNRHCCIRCRDGALFHQHFLL